jgi:hypothetical protein
MNPAALYDTLNCAALAVDEAGNGRMGPAMAAWMDSRTAAAGAFPPCTPLSHALTAVVSASGPSLADDPERGALWRALNAAAGACLIAEEGDPDIAGPLLLDASGLAAQSACREALASVLAAIWDLVITEVAA